MAHCAKRGAACALVLASFLACGLQVLRPLLVWYMAFFYNITGSMRRSDVRYFSSDPRDGFLEPVFAALPGDNHSTQICRLSMYTKLTEELRAACIMTPLKDRRVTLPPAERAEAYLQACLEVLPGLPADQRAVLESINPVPPPWQFHLNVTHPWMNGRWTQPMFEKVDLLMDALPGPVHPDGNETQWIRDRDHQLASMPSFKDRLKPREELETLPPAFVDGFDQLGIFPVKDEHVDVKEIPDALLEGRTVIFDATKLCGKEVFNLTIPDIARLHGAEAADIPVFRTSSAGFGDGTYDSLEEAGHRFKMWNEMGLQHHPEFGPFYTQAQGARSSSSSWTRRLTDSVLAGPLREYRHMSTQTTVNVKRLPKLPLQDMKKSMGNPAWVERLWNLLWIGPNHDFWHFDEEDNLLICISGSLYVAVMEQPYTNAVSGSRDSNVGFNNLEGFFRLREEGRTHWVDENQWIRQVPIHFLHLKPGMGITVPSRTYHNVMAPDGNRILLNCFFFPRWRQREAADGSWYRHGSQADTLRAMRHLKAASLWRLWDTRQIGGFFSGYKLEFL